MKSDLVTGRRGEINTEDDDTSAFMYVLTSIYMYLFIVVLAIVMAINAMADSWKKDIMGSVTVQIIPVEDENKHVDAEKTLEQQNKVLQYIENLSAVASAKALDTQTIEKLMTPWLGNKVNISSLPIPVLLDVKLKPNSELNYDEVTRGLRQVSEYASIDNHRLWLNRLLKFAASLKNIAITVLLMVIGICAFSIYYSTRTSLGININSIEILHIIGAKDDYIARQYARNFVKIGFFSGIIGLMAAIPSIILVAKYGVSTGSGLIKGAQLSTLAWSLIMTTPLFSALYAMIVSYFTVKKSLEKMI
ncbi:MAG: hypothetical protein MR350_03630 [Alphaproteobacteria bacterium]|nr:hypothetical protein [Alphaproteobacteria bacterium]